MIRLIFGLLRNPLAIGWAVAAVMALTGGAYTLGRIQGAAAANARYVAAQARLQAQVIRAAELASRREAARLAAEAARRKLEQELEDAARQDPNAGRIALGADSVRRLNRR